MIQNPVTICGKGLSGNSEPLQSTGGAGHNVDVGLAGSAQAHDRERVAVAGARQKVTWVTGVTEVTVTVAQEAAGTAELAASLAISFDAPSDLVADTWLTAADSETADSNRRLVFVGQPRTFYFTGDGITRLDMIRNFGSENLNVIVEAA